MQASLMISSGKISVAFLLAIILLLFWTHPVLCEEMVSSPKADLANGRTGVAVYGGGRY